MPVCGGIEEVGFLVEDEHALAAAVGRLGEIDPRSCEERFGVEGVARGYETVYRAAVEERPRAGAAAPSG